MTLTGARKEDDFGQIFFYKQLRILHETMITYKLLERQYHRSWKYVIKYQYLSVKLKTLN
jgi:hypothetical protein